MAHLDPHVFFCFPRFTDTAALKTLNSGVQDVKKKRKRQAHCLTGQEEVENDKALFTLRSFHSLK